MPDDGPINPTRRLEIKSINATILALRHSQRLIKQELNTLMKLRGTIERWTPANELAPNKNYTSIPSKRKMSAEARQKLSDRQKERWAAARPRLPSVALHSDSTSDFIKVTIVN